MSFRNKKGPFNDFSQITYSAGFLHNVGVKILPVFSKMYIWSLCKAMKYLCLIISQGKNSMTHTVWTYFHICDKRGLKDSDIIDADMWPKYFGPKIKMSLMSQ